MYKLDDAISLTRAGLIPGIPIETYHSGLGASKSQLDQLAKSPAHYLASLTTQRKETDAMKIGSLFHTMVLEPEKANFVVGPDVNKNTNQWKDFKYDAEANGQTIIDQATMDMLNGMVASVRAHPAANSLLSGPGIAEGSAFWIDEQSGELCRCRPDFYRSDLGIIVDLKSTEDASPEGFVRSISKYFYHKQGAFYSDGLEAALGKSIRGFVFVATEKTPPYLTATYELDGQSIEAGRVLYRKNLETLAECKRSGIWPGYSDKIETLSLPNYALKGVWE